MRIFKLVVFSFLLALVQVSSAYASLPDYLSLKAEQPTLSAKFQEHTDKYKICQRVYTATQAAVSSAEYSAKLAEFKQCFAVTRDIREKISEMMMRLYSVKDNEAEVVRSGWTKKQYDEAQKWWEEFMSNYRKMADLQTKNPTFIKMSSLMEKDS